MIEGNFHFISAFWKGESAIIKIDNEIFWMENHDWEEYKTLDLCSISLKDLMSLIWSSPINFVIPHSEKKIKIEI